MNSPVKMICGKSGQGTMLEYVIIAVLVGLVVLFAVNRWGAALRARFSASRATVNAVQVRDGVTIVVEDHGQTGTARAAPGQ